MSRTICLFSELDSYTGTYSQDDQSLSQLLQHLKVACLLYDEVIVHSNALLDHALTLPAFEELYLFTKSGTLWTTAPKNQGNPEDYVHLRAKRYYGENLNRGISQTGTDKLLHIIERWQRISPIEWKLTRNVSGQQGSAIENIIMSLRDMTHITKQAERAKMQLIEIAHHMQEKGVFDRNEMITRLGNMRELLSPKEISEMGLVILGEYTAQGGQNQDGFKISLFPGKYIKFIQEKSSLFRGNSFPSDFNTLEKIEYRLLNSGFALHKLASLPTSEIFELSQSSDWKVWREYLLSKQFSYESIKEIKSLNKIYERLLNALPCLLKNLDLPSNTKKAKLPYFYLPTPWVTSGLALIGTVLEKKTSVKNFPVTLDIQSRLIQYQDKNAILDKPSITLISLFASTNSIGIPVETIKQLDVELDLVKRYFQNHWITQSKDAEDLSIARLNRLNVAKNRLNKILKPLYLMLSVKKGEGIWQFKSLLTDNPIDIKLINTPWQKKNQAPQEISSPTKLNKHQTVIWNYCIRRYGTFISGEAISIEIDKPQLTQQQVARIMYKLQKTLEHTSYHLLKSYQGEYCLLYTGKTD